MNILNKPSPVSPVLDLYAELGAVLIRYLAGRFGDPEEALDMAQETWMRIHRLRDPELLSNPRAFLFQTATNVGIDRSRRKKLESRHSVESVVEEEPWSGGVDEVLANRESLQLIESCLQQLPDKCRRAFTLHRLHGLSYPEIAAELGVSRSMVEKYIIHALRTFRVQLDRAESPGPVSRPPAPVRSSR